MNFIVLIRLVCKRYQVNMKIKVARKPKIILLTASTPVHHISQAFIRPVSHQAQSVPCPP